tara:strand:- start:11996 stop:12427 length:432 start_codon:yes stop_codon:yes gene_type:complete
MNKNARVISFYPEPKVLNLECKNIKIPYSNSIYENYKQARLRIKIKDYNSALILCNYCLKSNPTYYKAILLKSYIFFELKDYQRAYSNVFLATEVTSELGTKDTIVFRIFVKYLLNCNVTKRKEIVDYLDYLKKIRHLYVYDI